MDYGGLIALALAVLVFGVYSKRLSHGFLTAPMVFAAFGVALGSEALGIMHLEEGAGIVHTTAALTLIVVLFTDASRIELRTLRRQYTLPLRMLALGMPLSLLLGTLAALALFPDFGLFEAALLAAILVPTDAALGQAVVSDPVVPARVRQSLNVESGLNDGIALPAVVVLATLAAAPDHGADSTSLLAYAGRQVILGPLAGVAVGYAGGKLLAWARESGRMNDTFDRISGLTLAFLAYLLAEQIGGNGFIAAFVGGLTLGNTARGVCGSLYQFLETEGELLILVTFLLFGAVLIPPAVTLWSLTTWLYTGLSLTLIRMIPVGLSVLGLRLQPWTPLFLGWFGPRGLASVLFALLILEDAIPHRDEILAVVVATVAASILLHGMSASGLARRYGRYIEARKHPEAHEHLPIQELPLRKQLKQTVPS